MLVVLTETYCNKVNIQITQRDGFIQIILYSSFINHPIFHLYTGVIWVTGSNVKLITVNIDYNITIIMHLIKRNVMHTKRCARLSMESKNDCKFIAWRQDTGHLIPELT